jgi:hypothetical protein
VHVRKLRRRNEMLRRISAHPLRCLLQLLMLEITAMLASSMRTATAAFVGILARSLLPTTWLLLLLVLLRMLLRVMRLWLHVLLRRTIRRHHDAIRADKSDGADKRHTTTRQKRNRVASGQAARGMRLLLLQLLVMHGRSQSRHIKRLLRQSSSAGDSRRVRRGAMWQQRCAGWGRGRMRWRGCRRRKRRLRLLGGRESRDHRRRG